jgi:SAM-dependent methyltransferase
MAISRFDLSEAPRSATVDQNESRESAVRKYRFITACNNCGSTQFRTWSASAVAGALHFSQSKCTQCNLVFANPQCDPSLLAAYYDHEYYEKNRPDWLAEENNQAKLDAINEGEIKLITRRIQSGRVLEVGAGTGCFLKNCLLAGFDPYGIEPSRAGVEFARKVYGLTNVWEGTLADKQFDSASFDLIYTWHVIEHVSDLNSFVNELRRLLKPGGLLWLGTENYVNAGHYRARLSSLLTGSPPPFASSDEHTYLFTRRTLREVLERRGFTVESCDTYQFDWETKMKGMKFRSFLTKGVFFGEHFLNQLFRTGNYMRLVAVRT